LRLSEARQFMLIEHLDASTAGFQVSYKSPSQFSLEYNRLFGNSPVRDIVSLRQMAAPESV
jgi:AraC-like DNA-binding protein